MNRPFIKMNGLGNDFVVVEAGSGPFAPSAAQVRAMADRESGVGCDQLISIEPSDRATAFARFWNADGGEVGACGNGTRCVGWLVLQAMGRDAISLETAAGVLEVRRAGPERVSVDMGRPRLDWCEIPLSRPMDTMAVDLQPIADWPPPGCVSMGNPHVVFFVPNIESAPIARIGPMIERHALFPERVNVNFAQIKARDRIRLRVWERGAGLTRACGTGACATLVAAHRRGLVDAAATIEMDGGELLIAWRRDDSHVSMTGPITVEFTGRLSEWGIERMTLHPAVEAGRTAVITGAASGIGLAAARRFAGLGLNVVLADRNEAALGAAGGEVAAAARDGARLLNVPTDVADLNQIERLRDKVFDEFGDVAVLMNNAGVTGGGHAFENPDGWRRVMGVNLGGVINGVHAFTQAMIDQARPALVVNTGSKQGITTPPGDTAYNVSKAAIKVLTEGLQHTLRGLEGCQVSAHLLIPGFTFTGMTRRQEKPPGAWTAEEVIDFMLDRLAAGEFYILCPDNDVTREIDNARITWAAQDITHNRPALSRWHPDFKQAFAAFMAKAVE